ncbi:testis anion transporter 1 isoform X2 [Hemicordylus capensis]|uniref:testis anion transporter 1 isoform X2 n=1 Tax=Hemicordylus capensis TaxID=884348 RepID=UPI002303EF50|nr:testis anion transporter 1 isoform X2 [Hemicordylus capensis]
MNSDVYGVYQRQPIRVTYNINRKVYNEEAFQQDHDQKFHSQTSKDFDSSRTKRKIHCRFSWKRFRKIMLRLFPILNWVCSYRITEWILGDLHAGINVGMVQIFQGLSGILLTGLPLPVSNSFYSAFCCSLSYVIFGTSRHISIGSFSILNAMMVNLQKALNVNFKFPSNGSLANFSDDKFMNSYMEVLTLSSSTTFLVGIIQLLLAFIGFGYIIAYLSETLMNAYLTAAALHVILSQFSFIFGIVIDFHSGPLAFFYNLVYYCMGLPKANSTSILLFLLSLLMLRVSKCIKITYKHCPVEFPMEFLLITVFTIISSQIPMHTESSMGVLTMVPQSFLRPTLPDFSKLGKIVLHALSLAVVSYFLLIFVGKKYAVIHNYHIRNNQELMAIGLCNVFSSFFKSFAVSCAISTTVIQEKTGGKTQLAALIGVSIMLAVVLHLGYYFQFLPNAVMAAVVLINMFPFLEKFADVPCLWRQDKYDFGIWIVTFLAVICLGLDFGLAIAMGFTFFIISVRSHRMKMSTLGQIPNTNIYRSFSDYDAAIEVQGVKIFQCCSSISSANMKYFKRYILRKMNMKAVPLDENEMRALISVSLPTARGQSKDFSCACVCDPPEPLPRVPYTEKLIKRVRRPNESPSSSSLALIRWTKIGSRYASETRSLGVPGQYIQSSAIRERASEQDYEGTPISRSTTQLYPLDSDSSTYLIHTIIIDFSMVHFVDLQASYLLRALCHVFQNIGVSVLIAACHLLFAVEPTLLQQNVAVDTSVQPEEMFAEVHVEDQRDRRSQHSDRRSQHSDRRSQHSDRRSLQSNGNKDNTSVKAIRSEASIDEPISDIFRAYSLQSDVATVPRHQLEMSPFEDNENDQIWEEGWDLPSDV